MRDLLILGIFSAVLPFAFLHPWIGVLLWTWLSIMNPHRLTFGFAHDAQFAAIAAGVVLISLVVTRDRLRMPWTPPVVVLLLFVLWMCLTTAFAINPGESWGQLNKVLKIQVMTFVALFALQERKHIELFVWINALSIGFFSVKGGIFTLATGGGGTVWGPAGSFIEDNNALAVAVVIAIPLMNHLRIVATRAWVRFGLVAAMLLSTVSALGSQSRGALLALSAMGLVLWYRSTRKAVLGVVIAVVATLLVAFMPTSWEERMSTIGTYEQDGSAMGRIRAWQMCFNIANHRPLGGGFDIYNRSTYAIYGPPEATSALVAHSIYFSILGEHGYVGLALFLMVWWLTFRTAGAIRKESRGRPEVAWVYDLAGMCQVSLIGYLVGGAFLQLAYFDLPYNILVILVVSHRWLREGGWKRDTVGAFESRRATPPADASESATASGSPDSLPGPRT
ncbi:MAG: putative O-glycosylation ligase, exosortase A system-associated [Candidatus Accumulibacter sp.]|uniref:putative O-glycosylation ligase, exosortase A system-associated n=1 Tax=Accumulibacter sp. TaxID=2053492 RepID=UPI0019DA2C30|nr:putative O-glycosylation ligase, exosortase A system-associated [Accumulibacter sp.]MBE2258383.1 putative O-glycosylation ligase, exosortase A system-associated [Paracoccaceae bacterium]MCB1942811.1 putative O-glycosylation ligase, exosortase A system-associated [Accumulibacter sp.]MCP5248705.1 putative O-glycosylation ligase, exosortase A system-associated [Accumulibacter sp.]